MSDWIIKTTMEDSLINTVSRLELLKTIEKSTIRLNKTVLNSINVKEDYYTKYLNNRLEFYEYFGLKSGTEHFRFLIYMSLVFNNSNLFDIGTCGGASALALASNPSNHVHSFDLRDVHSKELQNEGNIHFYIENVLEHKEHHEKLLSSPFIFLDTIHDGIFEKQFYDFLVNNNYKGLLGLDDIHLNPNMEAFWNNINTKKEDVTLYGHGVAGTGIVIFNDETKFIFE